jgi:LmbE family N-acetylglucosaminyl deacetylase
LWAREGTDVHYCVITDGSAGSNEPGATREAMAIVREREQRAAAEVLGVKSLSFLGYRDGELEVTLETRRAVTRVVRRIRPEVILAPDPQRLWSGSGYINHSDHKAAGVLALSAVMPDSPTRLQFTDLLDEGLEPFEIPNLWLSAEEPDTYVDIGKSIDIKLEALTRHESQHREESETWVRERARELGVQADVEYAEAFKTFSFQDEEAKDRQGPDEEA